MRYGLNERVELRVGLPSYAWYQGRASGSGAGDPWLGFKVRVVDGDPGMGIDRPDIAVETFFTVPAGGSFGSDEVTPNIYLIYAWNLSETMVLAGNVFYANLVAGDERFSQYVASLSVTQALSSEIAAYYEYFRYFGDDFASQRNVVNGGLSFTLTPDFAVDSIVGLGFDDADGSEVFVRLGGNVRW